MTNNKGFIKFEVLTIFVLAIGALAYGLYFILGNTGKQKYDTFRDSAISFGKVVSTNSNSFHNTETIYLAEVLDEKLLKANIKNPFESGFCDEVESKVEFINGKAKVTLKCGKYLIDQSIMNSKKDMKIYIVSDWKEKEISGDNTETKTLYNCIDGSGKELFDNYTEELYFVYQINKEYGTDYYTSSSVSECNVVSKQMYREKELSNKGN